ncbi:uncharacterized protein [Blastocystis hominis]|uniref:Mitochondrial import receptor subunit TOM7 homolog n=1 Tax=Blastocystis hominis TaxID=12968 RepID=D8LYL4_BLAHO|nr:uncharacterized protein [Blastocystis hominis]CBK20669.2 unnamed protein product [Blastocystis hominis]|eukprot:XP_012894717.1 uncharacterized protein [Blastocystis hominis]
MRLYTKGTEIAKTLFRWGYIPFVIYLGVKTPFPVTVRDFLPM